MRIFHEKKKWEKSLFSSLWAHIHLFQSKNKNERIITKKASKMANPKEKKKKKRGEMTEKDDKKEKERRGSKERHKTV